MDKSEYNDSKPFCFVASAVLAPDSPGLTTLQHFPDGCRLNSCPGRLFVRIYYRCGLSLARIVARSTALKPVARGFLRSLITVWLSWQKRH